MVVGNGLLAKVFSEFTDINDVLIFASGVSNSNELRVQEFEREFSLLKKTMQNNPEKKIVYFSTLSLEDTSVNDRPYNKHKLLIEKYIKNNAETYLIARVSNVFGKGGNNNTVINFFINAINTHKKIEVWSFAERNIIDVDDLKFILTSLLRKQINNKIVNIATRKSVLVTEIITLIEKHFKKKLNTTSIKKGEKLIFNTSEIAEEINVIEKEKGKGLDYLKHLLIKYFPVDN